MSYVSSIIFKYGDTDNVAIDVRALQNILSRQGVSLLIDTIAERAGTNANAFKLSDSDRMRLRDSLVEELREALMERL